MMRAPRRLQRSRKKGYRSPEGAVYCGRPSRWGNPFAVTGGWQECFRALAWGFNADAAGRRAMAAALFEAWLTGSGRSIKAGSKRDKRSPWQREVMTVDVGRKPPPLEEIRRELRGKDLLCWCPTPARGQPDICHAAVLLRIANARTT